MLKFKYRCIVILLLSLYFPAFGQDYRIDFVENLFSELEEDNYQYWTGAGSYPYQGDGGYLYEFNTDINNNGYNEVFVTSSLPSSGWSVYEQQPDGQYKKYNGAVNISNVKFYKKQTPEGVVLSSVDLQARSASIFESLITHSGDIIYREREIPREDFEKFDPDIDTYSQLDVGDFFTPGDIKKITLSEFLLNPQKPWRPYDLKYGLFTQINDPEESSHNNLNKRFTHRYAEALINELTGSDSIAIQDSLVPAQSELPPTAVIPEETESLEPQPSDLPATQSAKPLERIVTDKYSSWNYSIFGLVAILFVGIVAIIFFRKRG